MSGEFTSSYVEVVSSGGFGQALEPPLGRITKKAKKKKKTTATTKPREQADQAHPEADPSPRHKKKKKTTKKKKKTEDGSAEDGKTKKPKKKKKKAKKAKEETTVMEEEEEGVGSRVEGMYSAELAGLQPERRDGTTPVATGGRAGRKGKHAYVAETDELARLRGARVMEESDETLPQVYSSYYANAQSCLMASSASSSSSSSSSSAYESALADARRESNDEASAGGRDEEAHAEESLYADVTLHDDDDDHHRHHKGHRRGGGDDDGGGDDGHKDEGANGSADDGDAYVTADSIIKANKRSSSSSEDGDEVIATGAYTDPMHYSAFVSPRSAREDDGKGTAKAMSGYSTPVLSGYQSIVKKDPSKDDGTAEDDFPVLTAEDMKQGKPTDEESVLKQVAALLASLPDNSRQRIVGQIANRSDGANYQLQRSQAKRLTSSKSTIEEDSSPRAIWSEGRQWNEEYQRVVEKGLRELTPHDVRTIARLSHDFVAHAETYAKIIINELNVPDHRKTIKPAGVGGLAGGTKYIVQGILFKFCLDPLVAKKPLTWLYGGERPDDENAMKAAGLELQGLGLVSSSYIAKLHVPLMALVDYKGFRLVATSVIPIGPDTLQYGSNDAGKTVKYDDPKLNHLMDQLGAHLNLKKHLVGKQRAPIVGPGDIEGHLGTDGRYYLLDYARLMPPEAPLADENGKIDGRSVFFRMLRPELVRSFHLPLSSDTFTGWGMYDNNRVAYENDVREATSLMVEKRIPALAEELNDLYQEGLCDGKSITPAQLEGIVEQLNLVARMHAKGINLRHLGRLRQKVWAPRGKSLLMSMGVSRAFKSKLRKRMRLSVQNQKHSGVSSESTCKDVIIEFFNTVLGHTDKSDHFWKVSVKNTLRRKFPFILTEEESKKGYDLRNSLCIKLVFMLSFRLGLAQFPSSVVDAIFKDPSSVRLVETDVLNISATIKHTHLMCIFDGNICTFEATNGNHMASDALRLLRQARQHLITATNLYPACPYANWVLGDIEADIASRLMFDQESDRLYLKAYTRFETACHLDKANPGPLETWATTLEKHAARLAAMDGDPGRVVEMRALAAEKRQMAARLSSASTTCSLLTSGSTSCNLITSGSTSCSLINSNGNTCNLITSGSKSCSLINSNSNTCNLITSGSKSCSLINSSAKTS